MEVLELAGGLLMGWLTLCLYGLPKTTFVGTRMLESVLSRSDSPTRRRGQVVMVSVAKVAKVGTNPLNDPPSRRLVLQAEACFSVFNV